MTRFHTETIIEQHKSFSRFSRNPGLEIALDGHQLDLAQVICIARYCIPTRIDRVAQEALAASREALEKQIRDGDVIYGVNTGFGASADTRTTERERLQRLLTRELSYGLLPPGDRDHRPALTASGYDLSRERLETQHLPWTWARAAIAIRINSLIKGYSAVRPVIVERMHDLLAHDIVPMIPLRGSISASGDLSPLAYIAGVIQGKPTIRVLSKDGADVYADQALRRASLEPVTLMAKEGLAIVNGTAISAAAGVLALHDAHSLAVLAQYLTAMSVEALLGTTESFHEFFAECRPHPGQSEAAKNILALLHGSRLAVVNDGSDSIMRQDRYSIRTAPQWLGPVLEDLLLAHQQITTECNSATDNPLIDSTGHALHGGNFQAKSVTSAMEKTRQAMETIGRMLYIQCVEIINPATSRGLPPNLVGEDPSTTGIFKGTDIHIAALQAELGFLTAPMNHVQNAEMGNQSLNSLALISARYTHTATNVLSELAAAHLLALCQAVDLRAMQLQFLSSFRIQFSALMERAVLSQALVANDPAQLKSLEGSLWQHLSKSFEATAHLDATERFTTIAKSLRSPALDHGALEAFKDPLSMVESLVKLLQVSLHESWCLHRDAYLSHGDATEYLGVGSKALYEFVRRTLKIPFLSTAKILTPVEFDAAASGGQAPTVGSYTGTLYRAIRDGALTNKVAEHLANLHSEERS